jgi:hypothetical protein
MTRKSFGKGIDAFLENSTKKMETERRPLPKERDPISKTTIHMRESLLETVKAIAHWERVSIKDFIEAALSDKVSEIDPGLLRQAMESYQSKASKV